jgi:hypothetical protein
MSKQQTALQKSIQRKKDRLKEIKNPSEHSYKFVEKQVLEHEITEDEKLLAEEKESYIEAHDEGAHEGYHHNLTHDSENWFNRKYESDGKR